MASIRKRGDRYFIDYRINGKRVRKSAGTSKEQAELVLNEIIGSIERGAVPVFSDVTFSELSQLYLAQASQIYSPNTCQRYSAVLTSFQHFLQIQSPSIYLINTISLSIIDRYKSYRAAQQIKNKTINAELMVLRLVFRLAVKLEYIAINPVEDVLRLEEEESLSPRYLSRKECDLLLSASDRWAYAIFFTLLNTGLRKYEIENLTWPDVDLAQRIIHVNDQNSPESTRTIPINHDLYDVLAPLFDKRGKDQPLVFVDLKGRKLSKNYLRDYLIKTAQKAGIPGVTQVNVLRNTFAARLILNGVQFNTVKKLMGASYQYVEFFYNLLVKKKTTDVMDDLNFKPSDPIREAEE